MFDSPENSNSGKWKSPFAKAKDTKRPVTPLETDHTKRDQVMKKGLLDTIFLKGFCLLI